MYQDRLVVFLQKYHYIYPAYCFQMPKIDRLSEFDVLYSYLLLTTLAFNPSLSGCLQLLELLEMMEISWNFDDIPVKSLIISNVMYSCDLRVCISHVVRHLLSWLSQ